MKAQVKKISAVMAFVCVFAAQAEDVVESANVFGLMAVNSGTTNTIVATPWMSATGEGSVVVSNIVKTTNLTVGDKLYVINGNDEDAFYEGWELKSGNYWGSIGKFTLNSNGTMSEAVSVDPQYKTIGRGQGVWLVRQNPTSGPFYLYGQYTNVAATTTITAGSENSPVWHLVGNSSATDKSLNAAISGTVDAKDTIVVPIGNMPTLFTYTNGFWGCAAYSNVIKGGITSRYPYRDTTSIVPAGTGFWYVSRGGTPVITW